ncbi:MAG: hypothetical protein JO165_10220 [Candidatus Eremiobacteraeota bacterium]|nr:hypothetical protein [Candidatus Eremiobacteraeota bacterium]
MATSAERLPAVERAFAQLIDYAGLFPPAKLAMAQAVEEYFACREIAQAWMLGRFIVPASRIPELLEHYKRDEAIELSVILDALPAPAQWTDNVSRILSELAALARGESRVRIAALEVPLPPLLTLRDTFDASIGQFAILSENHSLRDLPAFLELPRGPRWRESLSGAMTVLHRYGLGAKIRCGGVVADAFPPPEDVAAFVMAAREEAVPYKATAGLHHPVRHLSMSGFMMHGFLNVLAAAVFARAGADAQTLQAIVSEEQPDAFVFDGAGLQWRELRATVEEIAETRARAFIAYGSCSFREPVDDLTGIRILER